jgi:hypothetical protein
LSAPSEKELPLGADEFEYSKYPRDTECLERAGASPKAKLPATVYAVCDLTDTLRTALKDLDANVTPDNQGYYGFHRGYRGFYEVIDYNKLLRDAEKRNKIFFDKLNILGGLATQQ